MAKSKVSDELLDGPQMLHFGDIGVIDELNTRPAQDYGDSKEIISSMATAGWYERQAIVGFRPNDEQIEMVVAKRKARLDDLKVQSEKDVAAGALLNVLTTLWTKDGEIRRPRFINNMCFRRLKHYPEAMVARVATKDKGDLAGDVNSLPVMIPVYVKDYKSEADRIEDQLIENERNNVGKNEVSYPAKLKASKPLFEAGRREAHFRKHVFKDGVGQKIYSTLFVDRLVPSVRLFERSQLDPADPLYVPAVSLQAGKLRDFYKDDKKPTAEEVEAYLVEVKSGKKNDEKMATKDQIKGLAKQNPNRIVQEIAQSIIDNRIDVVAPSFSDLSAHVDVLIEWKNKGKAPELLAYLKAFTG